MRRNILIHSLLVVALSAAWLSLPTAREHANPAMDAGAPPQLQEKGTTKVPLDQGPIWVWSLRHSAPKQVPVVLEEVEYQAKGLKVGPTKGREWSGALFCYRLRSADPEVPYTWVVWSAYTPLTGFRLLSSGIYQNYLAWIETSDVNFDEVTSPREESAALNNLFAPEGQHHAARIPVADLLPRASEWVGDGINAGIKILSIAKGKAPDWTVKISGPPPEETFTLLSEDGGWKIVDDTTGRQIPPPRLTFPRERQGGDSAAGQVIQVELQPRGKRNVVINPLILRTDGGERREIPVILEVTTYAAKVSEPLEGKIRERNTSLACHRLCSRDAAPPYTWALWSSPWLGLFRLFSSESGENYLAWVNAGDVSFTEVSEGRDRSVALAEDLSARPWAKVVTVPVAHLVPEVPLWGVNALYAEINVLSLTKDEAGNWILKVMAPKSDEVYTLVGKGEEWRRD